MEWYFNSRGVSEVKDYFETLSRSEKIKLLKLVKRISDVGRIHDKTKFNNEGDKIYAFKPMPHRFLSCFAIGNKIIVLSAFHKKTQKLPLKEKSKALKMKNDYEQRIQEGTYYEE